MEKEELEKILNNVAKFNQKQTEINQIQIYINEANLRTQKSLQEQIKRIHKTLVIVSLCFGVAILMLEITLL